jgi:methyltransferase (TIGR00027 family)
MRGAAPSRTARGAAALRALHQVVDGGRIFADPLALRILGAYGLRLSLQARLLPRVVEAQRGMRLFVAARSAVAEAHLAAGVATRGVSQMVVLGAGLDTFGYRNPFGGALRVFEVDHPATQAWKRRRLARARIAIPASLAFAPVDFEKDRLLDALLSAGFDPAQRSFFVWLGVVPYLTREAIAGTLALIGGLPGGAEVVFDYSDPPATLDPALRATQARRARRVAAIGEPFLSHFEPAELHADLAAAGFAEIDDLDPQALTTGYVRPGAPAPDPPRTRGGHVLFAATV